VVGGQAIEPGDRVRTDMHRCKALGEGEVVGRVPPAGVLRLAACLQHLQSVLADRLQHRVARLASRVGLPADQALVDQGAQTLQGVAARLASARRPEGTRRLEGEAAGEDGQPTE
jgi:hypothetical protein